ncbi:GPI mannosyltransferase 2-like [Limulus polyphemus]|uniref:GPI mannosyltransferase 2 n=1 Tax=Limulus polyphemus TaxID=6850 RepID=A0ABM1B2M5_LIMPO|nr:GPI mannosyltransferase 2-like [Limulus polyphemus]
MVFVSNILKCNNNLINVIDDLSYVLWAESEGLKIDSEELKSLDYVHTNYFILLQCIFNLLPDLESDVFHSVGHDDVTSGDKIISFLLGGFRRWDAQYFIHVAQYGYTYENTLVFFPLFPFLTHYLSKLLWYLLSTLFSFHSVILLVGVLLNFTCFILAATVLYRLGNLVLHDREVSWISACMFCLNPASVFFSALYSESLFCLLTLCGLVYVERKMMYTACIFFGLSAITRSNGLISSGFVLYAETKTILGLLQLSRVKSLVWKMKCLFNWVMSVSLKLVICFLPFVMFQLYIWFSFCVSNDFEHSWPVSVIDIARTKGYKIPKKEGSDWCFHSVPLSYSHVQSSHWDVGFLRYYQMKQIPNFLLAGPIVMLIIYSAIQYFVKNKDFCMHLGLNSLKFRKDFKTKEYVFDSAQCFVYMVHATALTTFCLFCIHVQVTTRIVASSCPILYWVVASHLVENKLTRAIHEKLSQEVSHKNLDHCALVECSSYTVIGFFTFLKEQFKNSNALNRLLTLYFVTYFLLGTMLHVNYYPWT